jgi:DNA-binding PadR family transcriptional regulator
MHEAGTQPAPARRRATRTHQLGNAAAAVLGMVALGARSGYEIRRAAELSLRFFWALGPPQIYAELARLEEARLIAGRDESRGRRARRVYRVTKAGERALEAWGSSPDSSALELRDPLLLRLFFGDFSGEGGARDQLEAMRRRSRRALEAFEDEILPAAERTAANGHARPTLVAEFGAALHEFIDRWCGEQLARG